MQPCHRIAVPDLNRGAQPFGSEIVLFHLDIGMGNDLAQFVEVIPVAVFLQVFFDPCRHFVGLQSLQEVFLDRRQQVFREFDLDRHGDLVFGKAMAGYVDLDVGMIDRILGGRSLS